LKSHFFAAHSQTPGIKFAFTVGLMVGSLAHNIELLPKNKDRKRGREKERGKIFHDQNVISDFVTQNYTL